LNVVHKGNSHDDYRQWNHYHPVSSFYEAFSDILKNTRPYRRIASLKEISKKTKSVRKTGKRPLALSRLYAGQLRRFHAATFSGEDMVLEHCAVKVDLFNIQDSPYANG